MTPSAGLPAEGLYVLTSGDTQHQPVAAIALAIAGGAAMVQYRDKFSTCKERLIRARSIKQICTKAGVPLIINDSPALAREVGADGVHIGRDDADLNEARESLGSTAIVGVSCYNDLERAVWAQYNGADYVAFGCFYLSKTKPDARPVEISLLREAKTRLCVPVVAIGGITAANGLPLIEAGADLLAVAEGVFGGDDPGAAARRYTRLFSNTL